MATMDCIMQAVVKDFDDWHQGFKAHGTSTSFTIGGTEYTVPMARGEACEDAKTLVFNQVDKPEAVAVALYAMDMAKMGPVMADEQFQKMSEAAIISQPPPLIMADPGPDAGEAPNMFFWVEVEDVDKWIAGFKAHGDSKTGTWGFEVPITRGEFCAEANTVLYKCQTNPKLVGASMEGVRMDKLGPLLGDEAMAKLTKVLGEVDGTKVMKVVTPMPPPAGA